MATIPTFPADMPGAIVFPANEDNAYNPTAHGSVNKPRAFVLHTPEEPADGYPSTPHWFAQYHPASRGSTHYFVAFTGKVYQCVPERWGAIANGLDGKPRPSWALPNTSLNWQTLSVEIEGYAANIGQTLTVGGPQWNALVDLIQHRCTAYAIPLDREHIPGHYQLSTNRTDPGATFPWAALMAEFTEEDDVKPYMAWDLGRARWYFVGIAGAQWVTQDATIKELEKQFGPLERKAYSTGVVQALGAK